ncbi:MAG TPA: patatin-like phospholipase family protein [Limnochordales bacterium]
MRGERRADAVLQGGGVKVIGLVGALTVAEERGYRWVNVAGTSAGAMVAALLAAGYRARELARILDELDFSQFRDPGPLGRIPVAGPALSLLLTKGVYRGDALEEWVRERLAARGVTTFADLVIPGETDERFRFKLQVIAADISRGRMLVLPQDIAQYGLNPEALDVARAVRMSASLPFFYRPVVARYGTDGRRTVSYIVDGGLLSNFPVWLFDVPGAPPWPTFGFMLVDPEYGRPQPIRGPVSMAVALLSTMLEAHDARYLEEADRVRTIRIPTCGVRTTDFDISTEKRRELFEAGRHAAREFFAGWNFPRYVEQYRLHPVPGPQRRPGHGPLGSGAPAAEGAR